MMLVDRIPRFGAHRRHFFAEFDRFIELTSRLLQRKCDPDPFAIHRYVRRRDRWTIWMGGAGRSGDGLRMVSVGGAGRSGDGLRMVSRVSL